MGKLYVLALIFSVISLPLLSYDSLCLAESLREIDEYASEYHLMHCAVYLHWVIAVAGFLAAALKGINDGKATSNPA